MDDNNDYEQLMFEKLGAAVEDNKPERQVVIDDSDNEEDWRDDLRLTESSEEEDIRHEEPQEEPKKEPKVEKERARYEPSPAAKHARVLPPARCEMDTKKARTYADRARKGTQPTALPIICSGGHVSAEGAARAAKRRAMEQLIEGTSSSGGAATTKTTRSAQRDKGGNQVMAPVGSNTEKAVAAGLDGLTGRMARDRMGTALRESVAQFAQTAQMMAEAAKRMGEVLEATLTDMAVIQGQQSRAEAARIDGTRVRLAVMRRDIVRPPGVSPEATGRVAKGREKK
uniref:Uncharacterized protein n=1 Tax=Globodera rostochiensis TaxID=31243 RepID=A0A914HKX7_GLORO